MDFGNQNFNPLIFLPAAMCDMCATSTMYVGLNLTYASSFQMLRGSYISYCYCSTLFPAYNEFICKEYPI